MSKIGLIIGREYTTMVMKKSFIVMTLIVPILSVVLCGVLPAVMSQVKSDERKLVAIVDQTDNQQFAPLFTETEDYRYEVITDAAVMAQDADLHNYYKEHGGYYAIVVLPKDLAQSNNFNIFSENSVAGSLSSDVKQLLREQLRKLRMDAYGIEDLEQIMDDCNVHLDGHSVKWNEDGDENLSSAEISMFIGFILAFLTYMFVLMYGAMIMNSVVEEKSNRIVEVIVSCCKPFDLMMGKIVGVALVGLTQLLIWGVLMGIIGGAFGIGSMLSGFASGDLPMDKEAMEALATQANEAQATGVVNEVIQMILGINFTQIIICFLLYFVGGYLLYASLFAAFGSAVDEASDASTFTAPIMIVMVFALYAAMFSMENPDGPLAFWCSMIPFTSPIVMMIRLPFDVPVYELILSLALLFATALGITWVAGRIYRTGILMYGRKFTLKEILKWVKQ